MKAAGKVYIAGWKTADDWHGFRKTLVTGKDPTSWQKAYEDYFHSRLALRYLNPIQVLRENGTFQGEGFSMLAIQCTLVEFLESTVEGRTYRYRRKSDPPLGQHEYADSGDLFIRFLTKRTPFADEFDQNLAREFYKNVRCGLLHEAQTKGGWTIWGRSPDGKIASASKKIVYRDNFHAALLRFVDWYKEALIADSSIQEAFVRKFDSLSG